MMRLLQDVVLLSMFLFSSFALLRKANAYDIRQYGAKGDGKTDDTQAFVRAWEDLCQRDATPEPTLIIPKGQTFLVGPIKFQGPCKPTNVHIQLLGNIIAPSDPREWKDCVAGSWLYFSSIDGLIIDGGGTIDGRGELWWKDFPAFSFSQVKFQGNDCNNRPTALQFHNCNGLQLNGLTHQNSPRNHIGLNRCSHASLSHLFIVAPENSPNTDGIDISDSTQVHIQDSVIRTGDDCIAISSGSSMTFISGIQCGPGHGISIGSLGANGAYDTVEQVYVQNCTLTGTQNGARIKTWQGGSGYAKMIKFENIILNNVKNPIIIDQYYCNGKHNYKNKGPLAVQVSDVTYSFIRGTSASAIAINFNCSNAKSCTGLLLDHIDISSSRSGETTTTSCFNARGISSFTIPDASCLTR